MLQLQWLLTDLVYKTRLKTISYICFKYETLEVVTLLCLVVKGGGHIALFEIFHPS